MNLNALTRFAQFHSQDYFLICPKSEVRAFVATMGSFLPRFESALFDGNYLQIRAINLARQ